MVGPKVKISESNFLKIKEICEQSLGKLGGALSEAIANAISEGYKLGWEECAKQLGVKL